MPRYRVLQKSYINERIVHEGEEVDYDGQPGTNLEPLDAEARRAAKRAHLEPADASPAGQAVTGAMPHPTASPANAADPELVAGELDPKEIDPKASPLSKEAQAGTGSKVPRGKDADLA